MTGIVVRAKIAGVRSSVILMVHLRRDGRFGSKVGQIGPKWDKSGAFSDHIRSNLTHFGAKPTIRA